MEDKIDSIRQKIRQIETKYPCTYVIGPDGRIPQSPNRPKEIRQKLKCLKVRYKELNEQANKDSGIK